MARILRSPSSKADALEIWVYIANDDPTAADRLLERIDGIIRKLSLQPLIGKPVDELATGLRFLPCGSYLIFYRPMEDGVEVVRLLHGARDITAEFFRD